MFQTSIITDVKFLLLVIIMTLNIFSSSQETIHVFLSKLHSLFWKLFPRLCEYYVTSAAWPSNPNSFLSSQETRQCTSNLACLLLPPLHHWQLKSRVDWLVARPCTNCKVCFVFSFQLLKSIAHYQWKTALKAQNKLSHKFLISFQCLASKLEGKCMHTSKMLKFLVLKLYNYFGFSAKVLAETPEPGSLHCRPYQYQLGYVWESVCSFVAF